MTKKNVFVTIAGRPNVGKSTLLNALVGEKIAIVSNKPQTTRNRITGVLTKGGTQYVFLDTPGIHKPRTYLGDYMVKAAESAISETDLCVLVVEPHSSVGDIENSIIEGVKKRQLPAILAVNKTDESNAKLIGDTILAYSKAFDFAAVVPMSAKNLQGVDTLLLEITKFAQEGDWFFPEDSITDQPERQMAAEIIREKLLRTLSDEIPHGTAVVIEDFEETKDMIKIRAEIYCERQSHKGIIVGKGGTALKTVGTYAREDMEKFFGCKVYLNLWVKVKENWRDRTVDIRNFGYREE